MPSPKTVQEGVLFRESSASDELLMLKIRPKGILYSNTFAAWPWSPLTLWSKHSEFKFFTMKFFLLTAILWGASVRVGHARVACSTTLDCEAVFSDGSYCMADGFCSNPFHAKGCLASFLPESWHKKRICGSQDPPESAEMGYCRPAPLPYTEIRIGSGNWESSFFGAWIMQIVLSEILEVPVSIETGVAGLNTDFYNLESSLDYGVSYDWDGIQRGNSIGDCRNLEQPASGEDYLSCSHFLPESWAVDHASIDALPEPIMDLEALGAMGQVGIFVPKFAVEEEPSIMSYIGLQGEANRHKLARLFRRPTTWKQYCEEESMTRCATSDNVATRLPLDDTEAESYFVQDLYTGFFRDTADNDCATNPFTCTGHFADYPCGWVSYITQQFYHLQIALKGSLEEVPGSYTYSQLTQIWRAANATKSNVMMQWWKPEALYQEFLGTDAEFTRVTLPPPTQICEENRIDGANRCGEDFDLKIGSPEGACDYAPEALQKVFGLSLKDLTENEDFPSELRSPAYEALKKYDISDLELGNILDEWIGIGLDPWGYDPREATCRWVTENMEAVKSLIPETYPRTVEKEDAHDSIEGLIALAMAYLSATMTVACFFLVLKKHRTRAMYIVQVEFMSLVLLGLLLMTAGSVMLAHRISTPICISSLWLMNTGYAVEIVPFMLRVNAIHQLIDAGKQLKRVFVAPKKFYVWGCLGLLSVAAFHIFWWLFDPIGKSESYKLTTETDDFDQTIILVEETCTSESDLWYALLHTVFATMFLYVLVMAGTASRVKEDINGSLWLTIPSAVQFIAAFTRIILVALDDSGDVSIHWASILTSVEVILVLVGYVIPRLLQTSESQSANETPAELFLNATVAFCDIVGFTAWSSTRDPIQIFNFLDIVFGAFDEIAMKRNVMKLETVGDCYVAVTGVPHERNDHALLMARFTRDCITCMDRLTRELEIKFGPDTCELSIRIGIHSGPLTGGFLSGKGSRFQCFGDTMNTCSRVESSGEAGRIHVSTATAALLEKAGKGRWLEKREDTVNLKGKGMLQTYWLKSRSSRDDKYPLGDESSEEPSISQVDQDLFDITHETEGAKRKDRLIAWHAHILESLLKKIVARRKAEGNRTVTSSQSNASAGTDDTRHSASSFQILGENRTMPINEVKEIIMLPDFDRRIALRLRDADDIELSPETLRQLKRFVAAACAMYKDNHFHNFEHASHVVMSMVKMLGRIVDSKAIEEKEDDRAKSAAMLHRQTYGIASDPLTHFACIFSALIHDLDHPGVPNPQMIKEQVGLAGMYEKRSVAEQNSFDLA